MRHFLGAKTPLFAAIVVALLLPSTSDAQTSTKSDGKAHRPSCREMTKKDEFLAGLLGPSGFYIRRGGKQLTCKWEDVDLSTYKGNRGDLYAFVTTCDSSGWAGFKYAIGYPVCSSKAVSYDQYQKEYHQTAQAVGTSDQPLTAYTGHDAKLDGPPSPEAHETAIEVKRSWESKAF